MALQSLWEKKKTQICYVADCAVMSILCLSVVN